MLSVSHLTSLGSRIYTQQSIDHPIWHGLPLLRQYNIRYITKQMKLAGEIKSRNVTADRIYMPEAQVPDR